MCHPSVYMIHSTRHRCEKARTRLSILLAAGVLSWTFSINYLTAVHGARYNDADVCVLSGRACVALIVSLLHNTLLYLPNLALCARGGRDERVYPRAVHEAAVGAVAVAEPRAVASLPVSVPYLVLHLHRHHRWYRALPAAHSFLCRAHQQTVQHKVHDGRQPRAPHMASPFLALRGGHRLMPVHAVHVCAARPGPRAAVLRVAHAPGRGVSAAAGHKAGGAQDRYAALQIDESSLFVGEGTAAVDPFRDQVSLEYTTAFLLS